MKTSKQSGRKPMRGFLSATEAETLVSEIQQSCPQFDAIAMPVDRGYAVLLQTTKFVPANNCDPDVTPNCIARGDDVYRAEYQHHWILSSGQWALAQIADPCDSKVAEILQGYNAREKKPDAGYLHCQASKIIANDNRVWTPYAPMRAKQANKVDGPFYQEQPNEIQW